MATNNHRPVLIVIAGLQWFGQDFHPPKAINLSFSK